MDGKKTYVGILVTALAFVLRAYCPEFVTEDLFTGALIAGLTLAGVGATHKLQKGLNTLFSILDSVSKAATQVQGEIDEALSKKKKE